MFSNLKKTSNYETLFTSPLKYMLDIDQLNEITPYIDGGLTYGITKAWADALRSHKVTCDERVGNKNYIYHNQVFSFNCFTKMFNFIAAW